MSGRDSYLLDGHRVAQARAAIKRGDGKPLSQQDIADRVGAHRVTIARIENDDQRVSLALLERLAEELGRSREWLLGQAEVVDEFDLARAKMARSLVDFSEALDLLQGRLHPERAKAAT